MHDQYRAQVVGVSFMNKGWQLATALGEWPPQQMQAGLCCVAAIAQAIQHGKLYSVTPEFDGVERREQFDKVIGQKTVAGEFCLGTLAACQLRLCGLTPVAAGVGLIGAAAQRLDLPYQCPEIQILVYRLSHGFLRVDRAS